MTPTATSDRTIRLTGLVLIGVFAATCLLAWLLLDHVRFKPGSQAARAAVWRPVTCVITDIGVEHTAMPVGRGGGSGGVGYAPRARFTYDVAGKTYQGSRFWFATTLLNSRDDVAALLRPYPVGSRHTCYVDPQAPHESVLDRLTLDTRKGWLWIIAFGLVGVAGMVGGLIMVLCPQRVPR